MGYYGPFVNPYSLMADASNVKGGDNPSFTRADFCDDGTPENQTPFPQFKSTVPEFMIDQFIAMATTVVKETRWHEQWKFGMCLYVAHMATIYLQSMTGDDPTAKQVLNAAQAVGLQTSQSAGGLSSSYSFEGLTISGWEYFQSTTFGRQFAGLAKNLGRGGMYVW